MTYQTFITGLKLFRVYQWTKNLVVFAGLVFADKLFDLHSFILSATAFLLFSFLASSVYIMNDILDYKRDCIHPTKRNRPIASGAISFSTGWSIALGIAFFVLAVAFTLNKTLGFILLGYLVLNLLYTKVLKEIVIVDVFCISLGFILRVFAGTVVLGVEASHWLILCTLSLTLFLGFAKRKCELLVHEKHHESSDYREVLRNYSHELIDKFLMVASSITLVFYSLYTIDGATVAHFGGNGLIYTIPVVLFGLFRYLYLIYQKNEGEDPAMLLITDIPLIQTAVVWVLMVVAVIYA